MWEKKLEIYDQLIAKCSRFKRKGKTMPYTSANGYMFSLRSLPQIPALPTGTISMWYLMVRFIPIRFTIPVQPGSSNICFLCKWYRKRRSRLKSRNSRTVRRGFSQPTRLIMSGRRDMLIPEKNAVRLREVDDIPG